MEQLKALEKKIARQVGRAVHDYGMIAEGDSVMVALSGGKDSWTLLSILNRLKARAPVKFEVIAVTVDPGYQGIPTDRAAAYCAEQGWRYIVEPTKMDKIIEENLTPGSSHCAFCARLRRGVLYNVAQREGFNKIAIGHHADDLIETLIMAEFFNGEIKSMPPVLTADDGINIVLRPMCYVWESQIIDYARAVEFPVLPCACPPCTGSDIKRKWSKKLLDGLEREHPGVKASLLASLGHVRPRYLMGVEPLSGDRILKPTP